MKTALTVRNLSLCRPPREILRGVDLDVARREVVALMGLTGSGKTTVLRAVAGLEACDGTIHLAGAGAAARIGFLAQFHSLFEHLTVLENVCLAPIHVHRMARELARAKALQWLEWLSIGHRAGALPRELSGGEAQRAAIARALVVDPPILLLDEPTASLDPPRRASLGALLHGLASDDRAILMTSHDVEFVREHATRVLMLADGRIVESGAPRDVFDAPRHDATRNLLRLGSGPAGR
jgi:ABC-type polar amino acid transport system ATPase subunit